MIFFKKVITSTYFKSSNSSGFNPILQKFYEMICEIIVSKAVCGIFLIFCRSSFINNSYCEEQFFGTLKSPKLKYLNIHLFLKIISTQISRKNFLFFKKISRTWSFFHNCFFWLKINAKVFYKMIVSLWVCIVRHVQSTQNCTK